MKMRIVYLFTCLLLFAIDSLSQGTAKATGSTGLSSLDPGRYGAIYKPFSFKEKNGWIECTVPAIVDFEMLLCLYK